MASPFFSSYWNQPSESRYSPSSSYPLTRKPETKVISIPVHFVGSETNGISSALNPTDSAVRIQKVLRGFLVRKSVNKIVSIKNQVVEIERRIACKETVELIRKERLRINETLMALLFKLDSVRGIDTGVRDLRKGVIRKAIALQEKVDALIMLLPEENEAAVDSIKSEIVDHHHPICGDDMPIEDPAAVEMPIENVVVKSQGVDDHRICDDEVTSPAAVTMDEMPVESMDHSKDDNCVVKECNTMNSKTEMRKQDEEMDDCCKGEDAAEMAQEKKSNEELQTQMIRMMRELVDKNETQTRMINSLTHRVAQLEKAFLCDKLGRSNKKKKRQHDAAADGKQQQQQ